MNLFCIVFGWRKASRCKRLLRQVQCRLKLLRNKRDSIIRHLREDIVRLVKNGKEECALRLVEQLSKDQSIVAAYDLLDHFSEFIIINLPYIRQNKDCPNDINEAASSLLYASTRCGDLPELIKLRKLFGERYGHRFAMAATDLLPGNLVNRQVIEKLSVQSISYDVKFRLMKEITRENGLELNPLETQPKLDPQQNQVYYRSFEICDLNGQKKVSDTRSNFSLSDSMKLGIPSKLEKHGLLDPLYEQLIVQDRSNSGTCSTGRLSSSSLKHKMERVTATSESSIQLLERNIVYLDDVEEFQPRTQEDSNYKDQRLFVFKPTYPPQEKGIGDIRAVSLDLYHDLCSDDRRDPCGISDGKTSLRSTGNKRRKSSRKRSKRRSLYVENQICQSPASVSSSIKDIECALYYSDSRNQRKKNQKSMSVGESRSSSHISFEKKLSSPQLWCQRSAEILFREENVENNFSHYSKYQRRGKTSCGFNCNMNGECSLDHPCYFLTSDDKDDWESTSPTQLSGNLKSLVSPHRKLRQGMYAKRGAFNTTEITNTKANSARNKVKSNNVKEQVTGSVSRSHRTRRDYKGTNVMHDVVVSQNHRQNEQRMEVEEEHVSESYASSRGSCTREMSPRTLKAALARPPYLRATTMPAERPKEAPTDQFLRFASFQYQQYDVSNSNSSSSSSCRHIHPKLPDYDDFKAKLTALKSEVSVKYQQPKLEISHEEHDQMHTLYIQCISFLSCLLCWLVMRSSRPSFYSF